MKKWLAGIAAVLFFLIIAVVGFFFDPTPSVTSTHSGDTVSLRTEKTTLQSPSNNLPTSAAPEGFHTGEKDPLVASQSTTHQTPWPSDPMVHHHDESKGPSAMVAIGSKNQRVTPNPLGLFPRIALPLGGSANISAAYPDGEPGDLVVVQAEDGGSINGGPPVAQMRLDEAKALRFAFTSTLEGGIYRVTLRNGFDEKRLEFWGGPEPGTAAAPSSEP